jgi:hypothetical protein
LTAAAAGDQVAWAGDADETAMCEICGENENDE